MIIFFSGTGNTRYIAEKIAVILKEDTIELTGDLIANSKGSELVLSGNRIIWAFPTYSWGIPPIVVDFIERVNIVGAETVPHYMVTSCGDDIGQTDKQWRKVIRKRGWNDLSVYSVKMPNTYVCMKGFDVDNIEIEEQKVFNAEARISYVAESINVECASITDVVRGGMSWLKSAVVYPYFKRFCMSPKPFHVTNACVACGKCAKLCPLGNIHMSEEYRPFWNNKCAMCLRCYHACPTHAVAYGRSTENKGQFNRWLK